MIIVGYNNVHIVYETGCDDQAVEGSQFRPVDLCFITNLVNHSSIDILTFRIGEVHEVIPNINGPLLHPIAQRSLQHLGDGYNREVSKNSSRLNHFKERTG